MIPCQRHLFDLPHDAAYLNCAATSPLLGSAAEAAARAVDRKRRPWLMNSPGLPHPMERSRELFAALLGSSPDDVAIVPAASYGMATAARNLRLGPGRSVLALAEQFPSHVHAWQRLASEQGGSVLLVERPTDHDWTRAVLERLDESVAIAALPQCHWTDGGLLDLGRIGARCRQMGAVLVLDLTQSLGATPFSLADARPDYVVAAAHKWLLGPYAYGYLYVAPHRQNGAPLEENWFNRAGDKDFSRAVGYADGYMPGARRFDMGEGKNFFLAPVAQAALEQILAWGVGEIAATLAPITRRIADEARQLGFASAPANLRGPHMLGLVPPRPELLDGLDKRLAEQGVYVSLRSGKVRVSPHLYTTPEDVDRLLAALKNLVR
jgi:selenocysteine lyase/cysteine desulfurase